MLNIHNLSVSFGGEFLFEEVSFRLNPGDRVGLIGKTVPGINHVETAFLRDASGYRCHCI